MKIIRALFVVSFFTLLIAQTPAPEIVFSGVISADGRTRLALTDPASKTTQWVEPGEQFNGYTVARYDPAAEAVILRKGGVEKRIGLVPARAPEPPRNVAISVSTTPPANAQPVSTAASIRANLRTLAAAAQQYQRQHQATYVSYNDLVGPGKMLPQLKAVAGEDYSTLSFGPNVTSVSVQTPNGATVALDLTPAANQPGTAAIAATDPAQGAPASGAAAPTAAPTAPESAAVAATTTPSADPAAPTPTGRPSTPPTYTVQGGDTLDSIAQANGVTPQQLRELNPSLRGSSPRAGETIRIR